MTVSIDGNRAGEFSLKLRIPGRLQGKPVPSDLYSYIGNTSATPYSVRVNGEEVKSELDKGYMTITRKWKKGDTVELNFDMTPRMIAANDNVKADIGRVAVERGPLVYCAEWPDNDFDIQQAVVNPATGFEAEKTDRLNGITILHGKAQLLTRAADGNLALKDVNLSLIPYYAWAHRGQGQMSVWLPMSPSATRPLVKAGDDFRNEFETR